MAIIGNFPGGVGDEILPASETPLADAEAGSVGKSVKYAREDHVHPIAAEVTGSLTHISDTVDNIDSKVDTIGTDVTSVKTSAEAAKTNTDSIKTTVTATQTTVGTINTTVGQIKSTTDAVAAYIKNMHVKRYGFCVTESETDPAGRVTYLYDAEGMTPAKMNGNDFSYGDWQDVWFVRDNHVCMLKPDRTEDFVLNPNDYSKKLNDDTAAPITDEEQNNNVMSAFPLVWTRCWYEDGKSYCVFCESQYDDSYKAYAHTDSDGKICKWAYHATYEGSVINNKLRSLSEKKPTGSTTATQEEQYANAIGAGWHIRPHMFDTLICNALILMGKNTNSQAVYGRGHDSGGSNASDFLTTGTLNTKGQFWGNTANGSEAMKVFHMENYWADRWERIIGMLYRNGEFIVKPTPVGGWNFTGDGFVGTGLGIVGASDGNGGQTKNIMTDLGYFQQAPLTGSNTTYNGDWFWWNNKIVSVPLSGGLCAHGLWCGAASRAVDLVVGSATWNLGASPTCVGFPI